MIPLLLGVGFAVGCSCDPGLPPDNDKDDDPPPLDTSPDVVPTGDTAPPPYCTFVEEEPNDTLEDATYLETEQRGCGEFADDLDLDFWELDFLADGWMGVRIDAASLGSAADVQVIVSSDVGVSAARVDNEEFNDVDLLFPAVAGTYQLLINEETQQGGSDRFFYEVLVTTAKSPVQYDTTDPGTNTNAGAALRVDSGERVFGVVADLFSPEDWYAIDVPPGRHLLRLNVDAFALGSPGDFTVSLYDDRLEPLPEGCRVCEIDGGETAGELDPWYEYTSNGNETVFVSIRDQEGRAGPAYWYWIQLELEEL